jgi:aspartyl protease family protein
VTIGSRTIYNVQASIVDNDRAPLLLGQSALERFGTVTIDYNNNTISLQ